MAERPCLPCLPRFGHRWTEKTHSRLSEDSHTNKDQPEYDDSPTVLRAFETNRELSLQPSPLAGLCRFNEQLLMLFHARMSVMC